jgi:hypothetical protein
LILGQHMSNPALRDIVIEFGEDLVERLVLELA